MTKLDLSYFSTAQLVEMFNRMTGSSVAKMESKKTAEKRVWSALSPKAQTDANERHEMLAEYCNETNTKVIVNGAVVFDPNENNPPQEKTMAKKNGPATGSDPLAEVLGEAPPAPVPAAGKMSPADRIAKMNAAKAAKKAEREAAGTQGATAEAAPKAKAGRKAKAAPADDFAAAMGDTPATPAAPKAKGGPVGRAGLLTATTQIKVGPNSQKGVVEEMQKLMGSKPMTYADAIEVIAANIDMTNRRTKLSAEDYAKDYVCKWGIDKGFWTVV